MKNVLNTLFKSLKPVLLPIAVILGKKVLDAAKQKLDELDTKDSEPVKQKNEEVDNDR